MSLNKRLNKSKDKGEDKVITLRMPQNKVTLLEILSKHYELSMSTLIREMIDESIIKLAKEHLILSEDAGLIFQNPLNGEQSNIRFYKDIVETIAPELPIRLKIEDFCNDEAFDEAILEEMKLSFEYGFSVSGTFRESEDVEYTLQKKTGVKNECKNRRYIP
ncbi:MAG: hypothetical protein PHX13_02205 [Thiovulaceae bacterium]|nr:hypothetical protein [Sulfurimonadaceae bacterium]